MTTSTSPSASAPANTRDLSPNDCSTTSSSRSAAQNCSNPARRSNEPRDLLQHTLVHIEWSRQGVTWPNWRMWMAAAGVEDFDDSRCVLFEDSSHAMQAAIEGSVVALGDFAMVADDLSSGRLIRPFELGIKMPSDFAYYLVYPAEVARQFADRRLPRMDLR